MVDFFPAIGFGRGDSLYFPASKVGADGIGVVAFVCQQGLGRAFGQVDQLGVGRAVSGLAMGQMEGDGSSSGSVTDTASQTPASLQRRNRR